MALRRRIAPPFEVMRRGMPAAPAAKPDAAADDAGVAPPGSIASVKPPIVLRMPRGYAAMIVAAIALLLVLAYWVGHSKGYRSAEQDLRGSGEAVSAVPTITIDTAAAAPAGPVAGGQRAPAAATAGGDTSSTAASTADPRQKGLNYFILAHYPPAEAQRLVAFLRAGGVEAFAVVLQNRGLAQVVAARGFTAEEIGGPAEREYRERLRTLGRQWKAQQKGANDLADMYLDRFGR